jgi:cytochrome c
MRYNPVPHAPQSRDGSYRGAGVRDQALTHQGANPMKAVVIAAVLAVGMAAAGTASAQEALAKSSGCMNCHDIATKKIGPAYKEVAAKYKGKADAEAKLIKEITEHKSHPEVKASADDLKGIVKWVLAQ